MIKTLVKYIYGSKVIIIIDAVWGEICIAVTQWEFWYTISNRDDITII